MAKEKVEAPYPTTAPEVLSAHDFSQGLYRDANAQVDKTLAVLTQGVAVPRDSADVGTGASPQVAQMVLAWAIVDRLRQMMQVETGQVWRVVPLKPGEKEQQTCSKIERYLAAAWDRWIWQVGSNPDRAANWWYLATGRAYWEVRFRPEWLGTGLYPLQTIVDDPRTVFPVHGRSGLLWYTKKYKIYVREFERDARLLRGPDPDLGFLADKKPDDLLEVVEYCDDQWYCVVVDEVNLVKTSRHKYNFVPLAEAHCLDTPLDDARWASQSVLGPILDHIRQYYTLLSKLATGVDLYFYPLILYESPTGAGIVDPRRQPLEMTKIPAGAKLTVMNPTPNAQILTLLMSMFKADINLASLPEIAFGAEPQSLQSGFAVAQVISQVEGAVRDKLPNFGRGMARHRSNQLRLYRQFARAAVADFEVPVDFEE